MRHCRLVSRWCARPWASMSSRDTASARVDPGLIKAARAKTGCDSDSELVNAALAVLAAPDDFGTWFAAQVGRLPKDFELEL
jgi:hypothetical protein